MQQTARQQVPWVFSEQAIMKAKRGSHMGSNMTGHKSGCMWTIGLPKLMELGFMCRKASTSTSRCDQLRHKMHGTTSLRQICCKAQLVQQPSAQPSKAGMMLHIYRQHVGRKAGLNIVKATFGGMTVIETAK